MRVRLAMLAVVLAGLALLVIPGVSQAGSGGGCSGSAGSDVHRAGLVVSFGGQQATQRFCVEFTEESISGIELLRRSGLSLVTQIEGGLGTGVCAIDGVGSSDPTNCFKYSTTPPYRYWVYFRWAGSGDAGSWQFSNVGASTRVIHDGEVDGWSWGNGANAPPESPGGVLDPPSPTPVSPTRTSTPVTPTDTPRPTSTRVPTETSIPGESPVPADTPTPSAPVGPTHTPAAPNPTPSSAVAGSEPTRGAEPDSGVAGAAATPRPGATLSGSSTPASATRTPGGSPTARSGVIIVDPTQARDNAATSERTETNSGGGSSKSLVGFAAVMIILAGGAGVMLYRRRGHHV